MKQQMVCIPAEYSRVFTDEEVSHMQMRFTRAFITFGKTFPMQRDDPEKEPRFHPGHNDD